MKKRKTATRPLESPATQERLDIVLTKDIDEYPLDSELKKGRRYRVQKSLETGMVWILSATDKLCAIYPDEYRFVPLIV